MYEVPQGIDGKYLSIQDERRPTFERNRDKPEAGVVPEKDGTIVVVDGEKKVVRDDPFVKTINGQVKV